MEKHDQRENVVTITEEGYTATHLVLGCLVVAMVITGIIIWCARRCQWERRVMIFLRKRFGREEAVSETTTSQVEMEKKSQEQAENKQ